MMASHNQNVPRIFPVCTTEFTLFAGKGTFDFSHYDKVIEIFQNAGARYRIEAGRLVMRSGAWDDSFYVEVPLEDNEANKSLARSPGTAGPVNGIIFVKLPVEDKRAKARIV